MQVRKFESRECVTFVSPEGLIRVSASSERNVCLGPLTPEVAAALGADLLKAAAYSVANAARDVAETMVQVTREDIDLLTPARQLDEATSRFQQMMEDEQ